jgi:hypothetical protein
MNADKERMDKRREEQRDLCADLIRISWVGDSFEKVQQWSTLEDISSSGACLQVDQPIPPGTMISLEFPSEHCSASIQYCRYQNTGYFIGVKFEEGYRWSRKKFRPEHLIQFRLRPAVKR